MPIKEYSIKEKLKAAKELVKLFWKERTLFYIVSFLSAIVIIGLAAYTYIKEEISWKTLTTLFIPASGITYASSLILSMFSKTLKFMKDEIK